MNEYFITTATFHMMFYTDWVLEKEVQFWYGWNQIYVIYTLIVLNMIFVFYYSMRGIYFVLFKRGLIFGRYKDAMKERLVSFVEKLKQNEEAQ